MVRGIKTKPDAPNQYHDQNAIYRRSIRFTSHCVAIVGSFLIAKRIRRDVLLVVLEKAKQKYPFCLYGVCLRANHIHLLLKPQDATQLPKLMHWVGWYAST